MPPNVHKILIYGPKYIQLVPFPIVMLSEKSQKMKNKNYIRIRQDHTHKSSRYNTNLGIFYLLLISSDPLILSKSSPNSKIFIKVCFKILDLLKKNNNHFNDEEDYRKSYKFC